MDEQFELARAHRHAAQWEERWRHDTTMLEAQLAEAMSQRQASEEQTLLSEAAFGSFDGMTSVAGVLFALLRKPVEVIVLAAVGLSVASCIGMALGEYLGDRKADGAVKRAFVMGAATLFGTLVPVIPFFVTTNKTVALAVAGVIALAVSTVIGKIRHRGISGYVTTYVVLAVACVTVIFVSLAIPASAG